MGAAHAVIHAVSVNADVGVVVVVVVVASDVCEKSRTVGHAKDG